MAMRRHEALERALQALAHAVLLIPQRDRIDLEPRLVVLLENARHQARDRMGPKIRRHIADADLVVIVMLAAPQRRWGWGTVMPRPCPGTLKLIALLLGGERTVQWAQCLASGAQIRKHP